jgi:hypothetical protein
LVISPSLPSFVGAPEAREAVDGPGGGGEQDGGLDSWCGPGGGGRVEGEGQGGVLGRDGRGVRRACGCRKHGCQGPQTLSSHRPPHLLSLLLSLFPSSTRQASRAPTSRTSATRLPSWRRAATRRAWTSRTSRWGFFLLPLLHPCLLFFLGPFASSLVHDVRVERGGCDPLESFRPSLSPSP